MELKEFLKTMSPVEQDDFAKRCGTTLGHLRNVAYGLRPCGESLAVNIDRESAGKVPCETSRPDVDWAYLRASSKKSPSRLNASRKCG
jgi:DNA-binding transcriptional regulator YdaS (Cro superfamily)